METLNKRLFTKTRFGWRWPTRKCGGRNSHYEPKLKKRWAKNGSILVLKMVLWPLWNILYLFYHKIYIRSYDNRNFPLFPRWIVHCYKTWQLAVMVIVVTPGDKGAIMLEWKQKRKLKFSLIFVATNTIYLCIPKKFHFMRWENGQFGCWWLFTVNFVLVVPQWILVELYSERKGPIILEQRRKRKFFLDLCRYSV